MPSPLLEITPAGLYCTPGDFYIDPWRKVERAIITHAHSDHARRGMGQYLTVPEGKGVLQTRMGPDAVVQTVPYGEEVVIHGVRVSLHPAGHVLGSAQVRVEYAGEVWVVSGDYKTEPDVTCAAFEPIRCHTFVSECTFGLPVYRWSAPQELINEIDAWWHENQEEGRCSLLMGYSFGKAQRLIGMLDAQRGTIFTHGAVETLVEEYRAAGINLPPTVRVTRDHKEADFVGAIVIAPPSVQGTPWLQKMGDLSTAFASGWMAIRGNRRRNGVDRGFVVSDHADWPGLMSAIKATEATRILMTHGYVPVMVRYLREQGFNADGLETQFTGESPDELVPEELATEDTTSRDDPSSHDSPSRDLPQTKTG